MPPLDLSRPQRLEDALRELDRNQQVIADLHVGRLRGYGNAIVPQVAQAFIEAYCDVRGL